MPHLAAKVTKCAIIRRQNSIFYLELRKIAAAALAETQKQRDKARKKLEQAIKVC